MENCPKCDYPKCDCSIFDMTLAQFANWMRDSKTDSNHTPANTPYFNPKSETFCAQKSAFVNGHEIRFTANMSSFDFDTQTFEEEHTLSITTYKVDGKEVDDNFYFSLVVTNAWGKDDERTYKLKGYQCTPTNTLWEALIDVYQKRLSDDKERANKI